VETLPAKTEVSFIFIIKVIRPLIVAKKPPSLSHYFPLFDLHPLIAEVNSFR
jgi:hypothetical protein